MKKFFTFLILVLLSVFLVSKNVNAIALKTLRIEEKVKPGEKLAKTIRLFNDQKVDLKIYPMVEGFTDSGDESGKPTFIPIDKDVNDLPNWIIFNKETYDLKAGESIEVPVVIDIPTNAEPGGHYATIFFKTIPKSSNGATVQLGMNIGTLVILDIEGDVYENVSLLSFKTLSDQKYYNHLPVIFETRFKNEGNVHIKPKGNIKIKNIFGLTSAEIKFNGQDGNILPKTIRKYIDWWLADPDQKIEDFNKNFDDLSFIEKLKLEWENFALGRYKAILSADIGRNDTNIVNAEYVFWVWPWRILFIVFIILLFLIILIRLYHQYLLSLAYKKAKNDLSTKNKKE